MENFIYCRYCGANIDENSIYCNYCGRNLTLVSYKKDTNSQNKLFSGRNILWGIIIIFFAFSLLNNISNYYAPQSEKYTTSTLNNQNTVEAPKNTTTQTTTTTTTNKTTTNTPTVQNTSPPRSFYTLTIGPTHINAYGDDNNNLNDEWISIKCTAGSINLSGWKIKDEYGWTYSFPSITIREGQTVKVFTGCGTNTSTSLYWCRTGAVWNNDGDTLNLIKPDGSIYGSWRVSN